MLFIILPIKAPVLFNQKRQELLRCQNFSRFNSFENALEIFLLSLNNIVKSELNFKHSDCFIYHYGNLLIKVIFADGRPIGDGSRHIKDTPIKYEDRMCKYSFEKVYSAVPK